jgi:hypothetical protein
MDWSPFYGLPQASLTPSGLLKLDTKDHEVELLRRSKMELRHDNQKPMYPCSKGVLGMWNSRTENLTVIITTHRLVLFDSNNQARFIHLSNLHQCEPEGGPTLRHWNTSYKLVISTYQFSDLLLVFRSDSPEKDRDTTKEKVETALQRRAWEVASRLQQKQKTSDQIAKRRVGVDHILTKVSLGLASCNGHSRSILITIAEQIATQTSCEAGR